MKTLNTKTEIRLDEEGVVTVKDLTVKNVEIYQYLQESEELTEAATKAFEIGAIALRRVSSSLDIDFISKKAESAFTNLEKSITEFIRRNIDPDESQSLTKKIVEIFKIQNSQIRELLKEGDTNMSTLDGKIENFKQSLETALQSALGKVLTDSSGIGLLLKQIQHELQSVRTSIVEKETRDIYSPNLKGANFEDENFSAIYSWGRAYQGTSGAGVVVEDTRTLTGFKGKQGDCVVHIQSPIDKKIVIEMKAQEKISTPKILEVLNESINNRGADMAIYVAPTVDFLPKELGSWAQFENKIICISNALDIALRYSALNLCVTEEAAERRDFDIERASRLLSEVQIQMRKFTTLISSARSTTKAAGKTECLIEVIREGIGRSLDKLSRLMKFETDDETAYKKEVESDNDVEERNEEEDVEEVSKITFKKPEDIDSGGLLNVSIDISDILK